jgi:hypothetical protein
VQFGAVLGREGHVGEHVGFGLVEEGGELWQFGAQMVGNLAPLGSGRQERNPSDERHGDLALDARRAALPPSALGLPHATAPSVARPNCAAQFSLATDPIERPLEATRSTACRL